MGRIIGFHEFMLWLLLVAAIDVRMIFFKLEKHVIDVVVSGDFDVVYFSTFFDVFCEIH